MKVKMSVFFFCLYVGVCSGQFIIVDAQTKQPISYVAIQLPDNQDGFYTDNNGRFSLDIKNNDSIYFTSLGYLALKTVVSNIKDSIFLKPSISELGEVVILPKSKSFKKIGFKKISKTSWFGSQGLQIGLLIKPEEKYKGVHIQKIIVPFRKKMHGVDNYYYDSVFKLSVFSVEHNKPNIFLLDSPEIIHFNQNSEEFIEIDISNEFIRFEEDGIFICIERVGELNEKKEVTYKKQFLPGLIFSTKKTKDFGFTESFSRQNYSQKWKVIDYQKLLLKEQMYLAIQIIIAN